jgi:hypothetical protein
MSKLVKITGEVCRKNSDGSGTRKLIDGSHPSFAGDLRTIVFSDFNITHVKIVLWRVNLDGSGLRQLTR